MGRCRQEHNHRTAGARRIAVGRRKEGKGGRWTAVSGRVEPWRQGWVDGGRLEQSDEAEAAASRRLVARAGRTAGWEAGEWRGADLQCRGDTQMGGGTGRAALP